MFHSMVRGSSPAWYSRTSLYSRPAPRVLDRSSPPGWKPRRRRTGQRERRSNWSTATPPVTPSGGNPVSEVDARGRESLEHALDDRLGIDARRNPLVGQYQPVPDHLRGNFAQVVREDVGTPAHEGERPAGGHQVDRRAWARAVGNRGGEVLEALDLPGAARVGERGGIGADRGIHVDLGYRLLHLLELIERHHLVKLDRRTGNPLHDDDLFLEGGVIDEHLQHEAVELGFGERVGSVGLDRVLGREDDEWFRKWMGVLANRHLTFLHRLQQCRLHLGGGAVDLVGQQQVAEHRAELGREVAPAGVVNAGADQIGRDEVGGELDPARRATDHLGEGLDGDGLGEPGHAFEQDVAAGQQGDQQALEEPVLAHDQALDLEEDLLDGRGYAGGELAGRVGRARGLLASDKRSIDHETLHAMAVLRLNLAEMSPL